MTLQSDPILPSTTLSNGHTPCDGHSPSMSNSTETDPIEHIIHHTPSEPQPTILTLSDSHTVPTETHLPNSVVEPIDRPSTSNEIRSSNRPHKTPTWLQDYVCSSAISSNSFCIYSRFVHLFIASCSVDIPVASAIQSSN
ncbi:uncharacterized protein G2W53_013083 [Senna tora]|uniref:Uncharacterized protein n=1 Tax=Senna tora TaxID=362788 RepID=A0A834WP38_9FABA|nr:uncharacterized protein G2W53_013083 [Senna tora]